MLSLHKMHLVDTGPYRAINILYIHDSVSGLAVYNLSNT